MNKFPLLTKYGAKEIIITTAIFYFVNLNAQNLAPSRTADSLSPNNIKEKKIYNVFEKNIAGKTIFDSTLMSFNRFDHEGKLLESTIYDDNGDIVSKQEFSYNNMGKKIRARIYNSQGNLLNNMGFKYDKQGNLIAEVLYEQGNEIEHEKVYAYNIAGKKIMEAEMKDEHTLYKKTIFNYDTYGNLTEEKHLNGKDSLLFRYEYAFDKQHNKIEEVRYDGEKWEWKFEYTYNNFNKIEKENLTYPFKTSNSSIIYKYDNEQHLIEETTYDYKNTIIQKNTYTFENGKLTGEMKGNILTAYEYDGEGNKTTEKEFNNKLLLNDKHFDRYGNITSWLHFTPNNGPSEEEIYTYSNTIPKKILKISTLDNKKNIVDEVEYKYDSFGNLIEELKRNGNFKVLSKNKFIYQYYE